MEGQNRRFEVRGGKVIVQNEQSTSFECRMCKLRTESNEAMRQQLRDRDKKINSLKEELDRVQRKQAETKLGTTVSRDEWMRTRTHYQQRFRVMLLFVRYSKIVLTALVGLRNHPPGGVCFICDGLEGLHTDKCMLDRMLEAPARVVQEFKTMEIDESVLPIPPELREEAIIQLIDRPKELDVDHLRKCATLDCKSSPLRGDPRCAHCKTRFGG